MRKVYKAKKELMAKMIKEMLPQSVKATDPEGGFFIYLTLPDGLDAEEIFKLTIAEKVAFVTGEPFHTSIEEGKKHIRLAYSNSNDEEIIKGIEVIGKAMKKLLK